MLFSFYNYTFAPHLDAENLRFRNGNFKALHTTCAHMGSKLIVHRDPSKEACSINYTDKLNTRIHFFCDEIQPNVFPAFPQNSSIYQKTLFVINLSL